MIKQYITFECDSCGSNFMINDTMEAPPGWFMIKLSIVNTNGYINDDEDYDHFCCIKCLSLYLNSDELKKRELLANKIEEDNDETEEEGEESV